MRELSGYKLECLACGDESFSTIPFRTWICKKCQANKVKEENKEVLEWG